ncbi:MAG: hypothetical protein JJU28_01800 [Cyclobacteriaceae bacterium]|nr:hypothetical protein [Cyclobacteriaceae bacterium]
MIIQNRGFSIPLVRLGSSDPRCCQAGLEVSKKRGTTRYAALNACQWGGFFQTDAGIRRIPMSIADKPICRIDPERDAAFGYSKRRQRRHISPTTLMVTNTLLQADFSE